MYICKLRSAIGTVVLVVLMLSLLLLTACSNDQRAENTDTLEIAVTADPASLDPAVTMDNSAWKITYPAYQRLVEYGGASTEVKPGLAENWKISENGLVWTFYLREGQRFADGNPLDAEAVKFSFERILQIGKGPVDVFSVIDRIEVAGEHEVVFYLLKPFPPFLSALAANYGSIVNPSVMEHEQNGDFGEGYLSEHTMGSGVYQLAEWEPGERLTLELNPYAENEPNLDKIIFRIIKDSKEQQRLLEAGEIDIAEGVAVDQLESLREHAQVQLVEQPGLFVDIVYLNTGKGHPALKKKQVRQAISYAVDYASLIEKVQQGLATQMKGPIPKGLWGHDEDVYQYRRDVDKAKKLLAQAGVTDLSLDLLYSDRWPWWEAEARQLQADLAQVGIEVELVKVSYSEQRQRLDDGSFDLSLGIWSPDFADPYMFMNYWFDSNNFGLSGNRAFYQNEQVDTWVREAASLHDQQERQRLYQLAQETVIEEAPYLYLYQKDFVLPLRKEIRGFVYNPMLEGIYNLSEMSK